ncbi:exodeoxyribonuclease VII large subunit [Microvirga pudoricolor]|uniref:exodeoxyribonuclease VII large subunit n=1 Tax=Microvirga pudoricolor TaxID=2778729 RepID=UPI00195276DF|nr:exodeoxyribonuclease VII large subunit [Microvirga pudoricolor]MBM6592708.1 exodeoxyribonuclease VII large subunit [Microvirga pudoricolor]
MFAEKASSNAAEWSVSDLAGALKRTLEDAFGHVRLRGEVSGYRGPHSSGHAYFCIKDQNARIDAVIWKGSFSRLRIKPEEGMEVIATGRITTFPGSSKYQIVVEALEPAGIGALMALLEERRRKLTAEGLFAAERKRALPYLPRVIGVVTSPTGAVIRDILHRLDDRFPRQVLVWPVRVQGDTCAAEVAAAIRGFNAMKPDGPIPRPDVLIVARGGGSIEDLWGFNEEVVIRAVADGSIPLVSAVGHETDWTLIDHVADMRAPTPTGAAEMVVPVRAELVATVQDLSRRHVESALRVIERRRTDLRATARALPSSDALFAPKRQRLDLAAAKLGPALILNKRRFEDRLSRIARQLTLSSPASRLAEFRARLAATDQRPREALHRLVLAKADKTKNAGQRLQVARDGFLRAEALRLRQRHESVQGVAERLLPALAGQIQRKRLHLASASKLFGSLNYKSVLERGYALVRDADGRPLRSADAVGDGQHLALEFADGTAEAVGGRGLLKVSKPLKQKASVAEQGALF